MKGRKRPSAEAKPPARTAVEQKGADDDGVGKPDRVPRRRAAADLRTVDKPDPVDGEPVEAAGADDDAVDAEPEPGPDEVAAVDSVVEAEVIDIDADETAETESPRDAQPSSSARGSGIARRDPLAVYMSEVRKIPLLSREEEDTLARKFVETGDPVLARRLVTANLRLVVKIAHEYRRAYRNLLDLIQEGNIGLMQAMRKFDPYRGVKLSSYAAWWIRAYILKFILNNWRLVKIGTTQAQRKLFFNLRKEKEKLEQLGFAPEHKLLAERLEVSEAEVAEMEKRLEGADMSLDVPISRDDAGGATRLDVMPSDSETRPDVRVESEEFRGLLRQKLEQFATGLKDREEHLFRERWLTDSPKTLQEIGDRFGISRERARQIEKRLLDRLRGYLEQELGTAVDIAAGMEE
jgi:RNA polymerase sigma-32 factor